ncbi:hypothetical protein ABW19_dt0210397 [Dactylella cylindrospora]|nr:hypothetical protein ABW19_dt0210397 [Dactylella cylindrospora]
MNGPGAAPPQTSGMALPSIHTYQPHPLPPRPHSQPGQHIPSTHTLLSSPTGSTSSNPHSHSGSSSSIIGTSNSHQSMGNSNNNNNINIAAHSSLLSSPSPPSSAPSSSQTRSPSLPAASHINNIAAGGSGPVRNTKARACTNCKTKKIACRPGSVTGVCAKCQRDGKRCIVEEPTPRPVRGKGTSKARVAEMEKKLDGLVALLTGAQSISGNSLNGNGSSGPTMSDQEQAAIGLANLAPSLSRQYGQPHANSSGDLHPDHPMPGLNSSMARVDIGTCLKEHIKAEVKQTKPAVSCESFNYVPAPAPPKNKPPIEDVIGRNLVTLQEAEHFFAIFSEMVTHFPFYIIPAGTTVSQLRREKPVLLMAILTTAMSSNKRVQMALERDFRRCYSDKLLCLGEKSLELLQAGLIYLSWFQCHFSPKTQIFLQMMHLFISLVTELGYDRSPDKERPFEPPVNGGGGGGASSPGYEDSPSEEASPGNTASEDKKLRSKEIRRAFLGTWWLTNAISADFRKRIPLHYSSYMRICQQSFVDNPEFESDRYMVMLLRLQKLQEDVCETFRYNESEIAGKIDLLRIQMSLKGFEAQLAEIERDVQYLDPNHPTYEAVRPTVYAIGMYIHEIGLHMTPPPPSTSSFAPSANVEYTAERINILSTCLTYCKKFMDYQTRQKAIPQCRNLTSPNWMRISYALVVLSKLALGGTEPVDLCHIREKTVIASSNSEFTLTPYPSMPVRNDYPKKPTITQQRSPSPENRVTNVGFIPGQTSGYDGWDTSVVRGAVKMEVYLDRLVEMCRELHTPSMPIEDRDRERYKANGVEEVAPPDLYDFGIWMFGTMKEWYLAMVRREEEIEDAVRDAVSGTPGSTVVSGGTSGGSVASFGGSGRTRSTSVSVITPAPGELGISGPAHVAVLKKRWDIENSLGAGGNMGGNSAISPGVGGMSGGVSLNGGGAMEDVQMGGGVGMPVALPPKIGFDFMDTISDEFWGTMWATWPQVYGTSWAN